MPDIDAKKIAELRSLLAKATLGPWSTHLVDDTTIMSPAREVATTCDSSQTDREDGYNIEYEQMEADAALIVAMRNAMPALLDLASLSLASASDLLVDDVFGKVYAHCVIKYDPKAAKRVIREALTMPSKAETFYAVQELDIDGKYQWCLVEIRPQQRRVVENFGFGRDAESKAKVAMNKREFIESKSKLEDGREVSADAAPLASASGEDGKLLRVIDETLQAMASQASVPMDLWDKHSNAVLSLIAHIRSLFSRVERAEQLAYTGAISLASIDEDAPRPETWKERAEELEKALDREIAHADELRQSATSATMREAWDVAYTSLRRARTALDGRE